MKIKWGETDAEYAARIKKEKAAEIPFYEWHDWYAWFPVMIKQGDIRWFETVETRYLGKATDYQGPVCPWQNRQWEYRAKHQEWVRFD